MHSHSLNACAPPIICWNPNYKDDGIGGTRALMIRMSIHNRCLVSISNYALLILCMLQPIISKCSYLRFNFKTCHQLHWFSHTNSKYHINSIPSNISKIRCIPAFIFCVNSYVDMLKPQISFNLLEGREMSITLSLALCLHK